MPLRREMDFLPELNSMKECPARLMFVNYPNNPTGAVAPEGFFARALEVAAGAGSMVVNDAAYAEINFDGYRSPSLLEAPGAGDRGLEFHSFSKTFSMAGWRVGFAAGAAPMIEALKILKSNLDSGVFGAVLLAAADALECGWERAGGMLEEYGRRRALVFRALDAAGIDYHRSPATLYVWARVPAGESSMGFSRRLLERTGVLVAPGVGFGAEGEGYFRISITCPTQDIAKLEDRLRKAGRI
jgi:LL-diaminopimelate aminotransferase